MSLTVNYAVLASITIPATGGIFLVVKRAVGADDSLEHKYGEKRRIAHTTLISRSVSQTIGEIFILINGLLDRTRFETALDEDRDKAVDMASDAFQHRSLNPSLKLLLSQSGDDFVIDQTRTEMKKNRTAQALCMIPILPSTGFLSFWVSENGIQYPISLIVGSAIVLTASISVFLTLGWLELLLANRLSRQFEKHS